MPITFPGLIVSGGVISAAHINGIRNALVSAYGEVYDWTADVDASGFDLLNAGVITAASVSAASATISGAFQSASVLATGAISGASVSAGAGTLTAPGFSFSGDSNTGIHQPAADFMDLVTGGSFRLRLDDNGNMIHRFGPPGQFGRLVTRFVQIASGASVSLESVLDGLTSGIIFIYTTDTLTGAIALIRAGFNSVHEISDPLGGLETTDTGSRIALLADGDATYSLKNKSASTQTVFLMMMGL